MRYLVSVLLVVTTACAASSASSSTASQEVSCQKPPASELVANGGLQLSVEPSPAPAGSVVTLSVVGPELSAGSIVGVDAGWQCWDGIEWKTTHIVYRGYGDHPGQVFPINDRFRIQLPSIGLAADSGYPIVIPRVDPGTYRIADEVLIEDNQVPASVIVEVSAE